MNPSKIAKGKVMLAIARLASERPLHGGILGQFRIIDDPTVGTMAVGFRHGKLTLYFAPEFVDKLTMNQLVGVVEHECLHFLLGHVFHEPAPNENRNARIVAEECGANELVSNELPGKPITLSSYPNLPPNEDTETRYDRLAPIVPDVKVITIDEHTRWDEILAGGQFAGAVVAVVIAQAWDKLTPEQKAKVSLPDAVRKIITNAVQLAGSSILGAGTAQVPWQQVLRRYVGRSLRRRPVYNRPPRRFPEFVGILPGRGRQCSKLHVVAVLDTSGSVSSAMLSDFSVELALIAKTHDVTVIEADNAVRSVYKFIGPITSVSGRGGTNFCPAINEATKMRPDLLLYATDGYGKAPVSAPKFPVIWLLTKQGRKPVSWGREVRISS